MNSRERIRQLQDGSEDAFSEIFSEHRETVFGYAFYLLKDAYLAEDITQDVFMRIWRKRKDLRNVDTLEPLLIVTTRNLCFNALKKQQITKSGIREYAQHKEHSAVFNQFENKQIAHTLQAAIGSLSNEDMRAFVLSYIEDKSNAEIAVELNISYGTAKNRVSRALKILRNYLKRR